MAVPDVPASGTRSDGTREDCHSKWMGWSILLVGVLSMAGVVVLALTDRPEAAVALGSTAAAVCTAGGGLAMHRR